MQLVESRAAAACAALGASAYAVAASGAPPVATSCISRQGVLREGIPASVGAVAADSAALRSERWAALQIATLPGLACAISSLRDSLRCSFSFVSSGALM
eukprot:3718062-Pleurochrysis_carterae.AAC.3